MLTILVYNQHKAGMGGEGFVLERKRVSLKELEKHLTRVASYSKNISVIIKCYPDSPHSNLIKLLNICSKVKLKNLAVFSI